MSLFQRNETDYLWTDQFYFSRILLFFKARAHLNHMTYNSHACTLLGHPLTYSQCLPVLYLAHLIRC